MFDNLKILFNFHSFSLSVFYEVYVTLKNIRPELIFNPLNYTFFPVTQIVDTFTLIILFPLNPALFSQASSDFSYIQNLIY